jgi:subtilase family serine protease
MLKRDINLVEIAGGAFVYRVRITKNGGKIGNIKAYSAEMLIGRHNAREPTISQKGIFDNIQRNFVIIFPPEKTRKMVGNYVYHIKITTPTGSEIIPTIGHLNVIPSIKRGNYSDVDWGNSNLVILDHIPTEIDTENGDENTIYVVFGGGKESGNLMLKPEKFGDSNTILLGRNPTAKDVVNGNSDSLYILYDTENTSPSVFEIDWTDTNLQISASEPTSQQAENLPENTLFLVYDLNDKSAEWGG